MFATPQKEHEWLHQLVGDWECKSDECQAVGTESAAMLGGLWVQCNGTGAMPDGTPTVTRMTLGYNPQTGHYQGTWVGSMMNHLWIYDGTLSEDGTTLTLQSEGPDFEKEGATKMYQDIIEIKSPDHRILRSKMLGDDGQWHQFMEMHYHRA